MRLSEAICVLVMVCVLQFGYCGITSFRCVNFAECNGNSVFGESVLELKGIEVPADGRIDPIFEIPLKWTGFTAGKCMTKCMNTTECVSVSFRSSPNPVDTQCIRSTADYRNATWKPDFKKKFGFTTFVFRKELKLKPQGQQDVATDGDQYP